MNRPAVQPGFLNRALAAGAGMTLAGLIGFTIGDNVATHTSTKPRATTAHIAPAQAMPMTPMSTMMSMPPSKTRGGCQIPALNGTIADIAVSDTLAGTGGAGGAHPMSVAVTPSTVTHGPVTLRVQNSGSIDHELIVLPLAAGAQVGARTPGSDAKVDEGTSVGEVSNDCAEGAGEGIHAGSAGWATVNLPAGTYELVCNVPGHYMAGMYTKLTVH